ncbi:MAG: circularly permuted type 2 ATP-grasp protein [Bacteroidetes bacterium]|nr:circularly permuted type 2 ATP-grasp protein [Bacteroidota bacterium]
MILENITALDIPSFQHPTYWKTFFRALKALGPAEIPGRNLDLQRFLRENGVTYNIYGDPDGINRPWSLDMIPFLISAAEWTHISRGLEQRAILFNLLLKDIYGEQQLLRDGILPMEVVYNHPGFLRQCVGVDLPFQNHLVLYSADMARTSDGKIWVMNDRTQAPSGSGYALENRLAMARIVPELFQGMKVARLSPYFHSLRRALMGLCTEKSKDPRIVILTPGPSNETYFEHAYLASYLGYTLVQGNDLMVKDRQVWLKTIGGLEKVDVILRRIDDVYADPLELREDSQLGIPGLLQAVRSGNVSIANPMGSSVVENPGLMPFLPAIADRLLGGSLLLPNIASWWCGQKNELNYVLDNLDRLIIKRIARSSFQGSSVDGSALSNEALAALKARIKAQPTLYVGQEKALFAGTPALVGGEVVSRDALFRSFAVSNGDGYAIMTGGLTRTANSEGHYIISNQAGGVSKDTWVIGIDQGSLTSFKKDIEAIEEPVQYRAEILPSNTAENLFWVGRYAERLLSNARFQRTVMQFVEEANKAFNENEEALRQSLLQALTMYTFTYPGFVEPETADCWSNPWPELYDILFNVNRAGSLAANFNLFHRAVHTARDHWSTDTWRVLRDMEENWQQAINQPQRNPHRVAYTLDNLITSLVAFVGLNRDSISREQGWGILNMGQKMEQCLLLISMLRATLVRKQDEQVEYILQEAVLKANECLVNYRYKYRSHIKLPLVLDLMLHDQNNPRSLLYLIEKLKAGTKDLPKINQAGALPDHERVLQEAEKLLRQADKEKLAAVASSKNCYKNLETFLGNMNGLLLSLPNIISKAYFQHAQGANQLFPAHQPLRK